MADETTPGKPLIVVADDDADHLLAIQQVLEAQGFSVVIASDGHEAMAAIRRQPPSLVIADVMMPKLNGFQLCRLIKFDQRLKTIPVLLLSARHEETDRYQGREVHADEYLPKPFRMQRLVERVNFWLGRRPGMTNFPPAVTGP